MQTAPGMPSAWIIVTDEYLRVGFEPHELGLSPSSDKVRSDVEDAVRITLGHLLHDGSTVDVVPMVADDVQPFPATVKEFVRHRGWFRVVLKHSALETSHVVAQQAKLRELEDTVERHLATIASLEVANAELRRQLAERVE